MSTARAATADRGGGVLDPDDVPEVAPPGFDDRVFALLSEDAADRNVVEVSSGY